MLIRQKGMPTPYLLVPFPILSPFLPCEWSEGGWWGPQTWRISVLAVLAQLGFPCSKCVIQTSHQHSDNTHCFLGPNGPNVSPISPLAPLGFIIFFSLVKSAVPRKFSSMSQGLLTLLLTLWAIYPSFSWCMPMLNISGTPCKYNKLFLTFLTFPPGKLFYRSP